MAQSERGRGPFGVSDFGCKADIDDCASIRPQMTQSGPEHLQHAGHALEHPAVAADVRPSLEIAHGRKRIRMS